MKRTDSEIKTQLDTVGHVLRDQALAVPVYQRPYSWRKEHLEAFWEDLRAAMALADHEHFLGTIVLTPGSSANRVTIIDGQQRLATSVMFLAALRNAFSAAGDVSRAGVIEKDYLASRN